MMDQMMPTNRGLNAILSIDGQVLGGQQNCSLQRHMAPIKITNKINGKWEQNIAGPRGWRLNCSGMFIKNQKCFNLLDEAFNQGKSVTVELTDENRKYEGIAIITNFPVTANYNDSFTYNIDLLGTGELK